MFPEFHIYRHSESVYSGTLVAGFGKPATSPGGRAARLDG
jgi:hypothetical protein